MSLFAVSRYCSARFPPSCARRESASTDAAIKAYNYLDFSAFIPIGRNVDFRLGVNNIADKNPPLILNGSFSDCPNNSCNDNTWVGTYDTLGRYIYAHLSAKF